MTAPYTSVQGILSEAAAHRVFPGAVIEVGRSARAEWRQAVGTLTYDAASLPVREDTIFDLASLTKVLSTTPLIMRLIERGDVGLDDPVAQHLRTWRGSDRDAVTLRDLLSHSSGLPAYRPYYQTLRGREPIERAIGETPLDYPPNTKAIYSDLGFMLLGFILTDLSPLDVQFDALRTQMRIPGDLQFFPPERWKGRTAPTRHTAERGLLVGVVDDDNAWALGGAAGQAGLFGTAGAVGECARHFLQVLSGRTGAFQPDTMRAFVTRRNDVPGSSRALGWDTMLPTSSCGTLLSARAFGHTGFTGTSLWIDPDNDVYVVLLTNRVHPDASRDSIQDVRRAVHDAVMRELTSRQRLR